jgi:SAM-dependent methyltransferase
LSAFPWSGADGIGAQDAGEADDDDPAGDDGVVRYGPLVADERHVRLLGNLSGRRVLLLGCGAGQAAVALATGGAKVIAVDPSAEAVETTRRRAAGRGVAVELQQRDLAELAFVRAETIDLVASFLTLRSGQVLGRVFRQVHRVLRPDAALVISLPHPALATVAVTRAPTDGPGLPSAARDDQAGRGSAGNDHEGRSGPRHPAGDDGGLRLQRRYGDPADGGHTVEGVSTALNRAGFRLDTLLELWASPPAGASGTGAAPSADEDRAAPTGRRRGDARYWHPAMEMLPAVLVARARKTGL